MALAVLLPLKVTVAQAGFVFSIFYRKTKSMKLPPTQGLVCLASPVLGLTNALLLHVPQLCPFLNTVAKPRELLPHLSMLILNCDTQIQRAGSVTLPVHRVAPPPWLSKSVQNAKIYLKHQGCALLSHDKSRHNPKRPSRLYHIAIINPKKD